MKYRLPPLGDYAHAVVLKDDEELVDIRQSFQVFNSWGRVLRNEILLEPGEIVLGADGYRSDGQSSAYQIGTAKPVSKRYIVRKIDNGPFVQVEYLGGSAPYTYRDPRDVLEIGDLVEAPTRHGTQIAKVVAFGRGSYRGEVKAVASRLTREEL